MVAVLAGYVYNQLLETATFGQVLTGLDVA